MRSMTGFGKAEVSRDGLEIAAEIRALNQRFFEVRFNLPRGWNQHEAALRKMVQGVVSRGRVELMIRRNPSKSPGGSVQVNEKLAKSYVSAVRKLNKSLGVRGDIGIAALLQRPEILQITEEEEDAKTEIKLGMTAVKRALAALDQERIREGESLRRDLAARVETIEEARGRIAELSKGSRETIIVNFKQKIKELLDNLPLDEKRLYEEAAIAAQRADISEELVRLETHLQGLRALLARDGAVGKEIEFLLQELNREVNTIGAKSQSAELSQVAVKIKGELEKMREQVQNVE